MKIKWIALLGAMVVAASVMLLNGCSGCASKDTISEVSSSQVVESGVPSASTGDGLDKNIAMETQIESLTNGNITLHYPVLTKMDFRAKQESLNEILLRDAQTCMANRVLADSSGIMDVTEGYHTKQYLSFVSTGSFTSQTSTDPQMVFYVTNLDLQSGKRFQTPIRENAQALAKIIRSGQGYSVLTPSDELRQQQENYLQGMSEEALTALLSSCDYTDTDSAPKCFSYPLGEDNYAIYVPAPSSLTGYAMVQIRMQQATASSVGSTVSEMPSSVG